MAQAAGLNCVQHYSLDDLDADTAELILQLQLADLQELKERSGGKQKEGTITDAQIAAELLKEDLNNVRTTLHDQRMTRSIARAVQVDGNAVAHARQEEEIARRDHVLARRLSGSNLRADAHNAGMLHGDELEEEVIAKLAGLYVDEDFGEKLDLATRLGQPIEDGSIEPDAQAESSSWAAGRIEKNHTIQHSATRRCEACREEKKFFDLIPAQCRHEYCRDCIVELFISSFTDESLFPPRCCRVPISLETASIFLTKNLKEQYAEKKIEFGTSNRTYCTRSDCSAFVRPEHIAGQVANCIKCRTQTCTICKALAHAGRDCPDDPNTEAVRALARREGWQTCYSCRRLVELNTGCYHMTCLCRAEFCYHCGRRWKTCECELWAEERLVNRAEVIMERQVREGPRNQAAVVGQARQLQIREIAEQLRRDHECDHDRWRYVGGRHECEECHHTLPQYIFECRQCRLRACNRCRRNRL